MRAADLRPPLGPCDSEAGRARGLSCQTQQVSMIIDISTLHSPEASRSVSTPSRSCRFCPEEAQPSRSRRAARAGRRLTSEGFGRRRSRCGAASGAPARPPGALPSRLESESRPQPARPCDNYCHGSFRNGLLRRCAAGSPSLPLHISRSPSPAIKNRPPASDRNRPAASARPFAHWRSGAFPRALPCFLRPPRSPSLLATRSCRPPWRRLPGELARPPQALLLCPLRIIACGLGPCKRDVSSRVGLPREPVAPGLLIACAPFNAPFSSLFSLSLFRLFGGGRRRHVDTLAGALVGPESRKPLAAGGRNVKAYSRGQRPDL